MAMHFRYLLAIGVAVTIAACSPKSQSVVTFCGGENGFMGKYPTLSTNSKDIPKKVLKELQKQHHITLVADSTLISTTKSYFKAYGGHGYKKKGYIAVLSKDLYGKQINECILYKFVPEEEINYSYKPKRGYMFSFNAVPTKSVVWDSIKPNIDCANSSRRGLFGGGVKKEHWWKRKK